MSLLENAGVPAKSRRHSALIAVLGLFLACAGCSNSLTGFAVAGQPARYDIAIIGGRVIDPETGLDAVRNVGVLGDKIAALTGDDIAGDVVVDASGYVVAPGFIDLHAHGQTILGGRVQALDGVTTALDLEAGYLPVSDFYENAGAEGRAVNYGASVNWGAARISAFTGKEPRAERNWFSAHFGNLSWQNELASPEQIAKIEALVTQGLDDGGIGVGILLGYTPGAGYKEYYRLSALAASRGAPTFIHPRHISMLEPDSSFESISQIISVAASTGVHAHIAHLNSSSLLDIEMIGGAIRTAQNAGIQITTEAYPYGAGSTGIGSALFTGRNWRARMGGLTASSFQRSGKRLTEEEFARLQREEPDTFIVVDFFNMEKKQHRDALDQAVLFPGGAIASDGLTWSLNGAPASADAWPLPENARAHPRSAGTFSRFLRIYVREKKAISLLEAIDRISLTPARILEGYAPQMKSKGRIQVGADADIVVFDLASVSDRATFGRPAQTSVGFQHVFVNGVHLVNEGVLNSGVLPGRAIRRSAE